NGNQIIPQSALYTTTVLGDTLITFDDFPVGTALTNQYASRGVLFNRTGGNVQVTNARPTQFVPVSGTQVYGDPDPNPTPPPPSRTATTPSPAPAPTPPASTDFVSLYVINAASIPATVQAFDPGGNLIFSQQCNQGAGTQQRVVIEASQIAKVVVTLGSGADP